MKFNGKNFTVHWSLATKCQQKKKSWVFYAHIQINKNLIPLTFAFLHSQCEKAVHDAAFPLAEVPLGVSSCTHSSVTMKELGTPRDIAMDLCGYFFYLILIFRPLHVYKTCLKLSSRSKRYWEEKKKSDKLVETQSFHFLQMLDWKSFPSFYSLFLYFLKTYRYLFHVYWVVILQMGFGYKN